MDTQLRKKLKDSRLTPQEALRLYLQIGQPELAAKVLDTVPMDDEFEFNVMVKKGFRFTGHGMFSFTSHGMFRPIDTDTEYGGVCLTEEAISEFFSKIKGRAKHFNAWPNQIVWNRIFYIISVLGPKPVVLGAAEITQIELECLGQHRNALIAEAATCYLKHQQALRAAEEERKQREADHYRRRQEAAERNRREAEEVREFQWNLNSHVNEMWDIYAAEGNLKTIDQKNRKAFAEAVNGKHPLAYVLFHAWVRGIKRKTDFYSFVKEYDILELATKYLKKNAE